MLTQTADHQQLLSPLRTNYSRKGRCGQLSFGETFHQETYPWERQTSKALHMTEGDRILNIVDRMGKLEGTIQQFMAQWNGSEQNAQSSRRVMYDRLELLSSQINRVATDVQSMQQDVAEMRIDIDEKIMPEVTTIQRDRDRKLGAKSVWAMIGAGIIALGSAIAWGWDKLFIHWKP